MTYGFVTDTQNHYSPSERARATRKRSSSGPSRQEELGEPGQGREVGESRPSEPLLGWAGDSDVTSVRFSSSTCSVRSRETPGGTIFDAESLFLAIASDTRHTSVHRSIRGPQ